MFHSVIWLNKMSRITVLHENSAWVEPLRAAFAELDLPYDEWFLDQGTIAFDRAPPEGVFYVAHPVPWTQVCLTRRA